MNFDRKSSIQLLKTVLLSPLQRKSFFAKLFTTTTTAEKFRWVINVDCSSTRLGKKPERHKLQMAKWASVCCLNVAPEPPNCAFPLPESSSILPKFLEGKSAWMNGVKWLWLSKALPRLREFSARRCPALAQQDRECSITHRSITQFQVLILGQIKLTHPRIQKIVNNLLIIATLCTIKVYRNNRAMTILRWYPDTFRL